MLDIKRRVDDVARGAALMTGTALTIREVDGFSDYVPNRALSELLWQCMREVGAPAWDEADRALAAQFAATLSAGERADNLASTLSATDLPLSHYAGKDLDDGNSSQDSFEVKSGMSVGSAVSISFFNSSFFIPMSSFDLFFVYFQNRIKCCKRKIVNRSYIRDRIIRDGRNRQKEHVHHWIRQIRT